MQQQPRLPVWFLVANWALIAGAFFLGHHFGGRRLADLPEPQRTALALVHREILTSHVDPQAANKLLDNAIAGMVRQLDPYSRYVPPDDVADYDEANSGRYEGIGAHFRLRADEVVLWFPLLGSPAEAAGLLPGDRLLAVDGRRLDTPEQRRGAAELVRGPADTDVTLRIRRQNDGEREIVVRRGALQRPCVRWRHLIDPDQALGYLHLSDFHPGAREQVGAAITALQQQRPLRGLILDLRFDGGGSLEECIAITRMFLARGRIVSQQRRDEVVEAHDADGSDCAFPQLPLVLLVNERTASASEVLAAALQDHGRAAVVGQRTHGKGVVNTVYTWKDLPFRLKLTTGRYRTPNGRDIERHFQRGDRAAGAELGGIAPDVEVMADKATNDGYERRLLADEVPERFRTAATAVASELGITMPAPPAAAEDAQLAAAVATLRERVAQQAPAVTPVETGVQIGK